MLILQKLIDSKNKIEYKGKLLSISFAIITKILTQKIHKKVQHIRF